VELYEKQNVKKNQRVASKKFFFQFQSGPFLQSKRQRQWKKGQQPPSVLYVNMSSIENLFQFQSGPFLQSKRQRQWKKGQQPPSVLYVNMSSIENLFHLMMNNVSDFVDKCLSR